MEKCRYWLVRAMDGVEWQGKLPKSAEVWSVKGSVKYEAWRQVSWEYVVRYDKPVTQRWVSRLPVQSVTAWMCDPHVLADKSKYDKQKYMDQATMSFYKQFTNHSSI